MEGFLEYGISGLIGLCVVVVVPLMVRAFIVELREGRAERTAMRQDFTSTVKEQAGAVATAVKDMSAGVVELRLGMTRICDRLEQRPCLLSERKTDAGRD